MKVSILMNGYNCEKYVAQAIESVFSQTYINWEIIFVDNCSTDSTASIVKSYNSDKIRFLTTEENIPLGAARNFGLTYCDGDFLCFLDTDDIWLKDKLDLQIQLFLRDPLLKLSYTGVRFIDGNGTEFGSYTPKAKNDDVFRRLLVRYEINQQSVMIRNDFSFSFDSSKKYSVDFCLFMGICAEYKAAMIPDKLVKYRMHDSNFSLEANELEWKEGKSALDEIFKKNPSLKDKYSKEYSKAYARVYYHKARYLMTINKLKEARRVLKKNSKVSLFYFGLYILALFPSYFWLSIHRQFRRFSQ